MPDPLLTTKLHVPTVRGELVQRSVLLKKLEQALECKLTLISAPAGFGKTTLLTDWIAGCGQIAAWLSLDAGDNDPKRFWSYFIAAFQRIHPEIDSSESELLFTYQSASSEEFLTSLINQIAEAASPSLLILDDYHTIETQSIHTGLIYLLDHLPAQFHLIIASRADPPWPLSRWRARGQLLELRSSDLRFTTEEAADFLNRYFHLGLSKEDVIALERRTEGWIAGLQMAALSLQGQKDPGDFITRFTGSNRYIFDYLLEEVLARQPAQIRDFLLKTSVLEQLTASLCEALTGNPACQEILQQLERANLFIIPLDEERHWYRYHHLFMDLLRNQLQQEAPDEAIELYRRASAWYQGQHSIAEALRYALAARDADRVARMVAQNAFVMAESGELGTVIQWLDSLALEAFQQAPWLNLAYGWALALHGRFDRVEACLQEAEKSVPGMEKQAEAQQMAGHIAVLRSFACGMQGNWSSCAELVQEGLRNLPQVDVGARGFAYSIYSNYLMVSGSLKQSIPYQLEAIELNRGSGNTFVVVDGLGDLAREYILLGKLHLASIACQEAIQYADKIPHIEGRRPVVGFVNGILGDIYREWNDLDAAMHYIQEGMELCRQSGQMVNLTHCLRSLARALMASGDYAGALEAVRQSRLAVRGKSYWNDVGSIAWEAWIHLLEGDLQAAADWGATCGLNSQDDFNYSLTQYYQIYARVLASQGKLAEALILLDSMQERLEDANYTGRVIEILTVKSRLVSQQGDQRQALALLEKALRLGGPFGYVRVFLDEGEPIQKLLQQLTKSTEVQEYVNHLLLEFAKEKGRFRKDGGELLSPVEILPESPTRSPLIEPLSDREREVLRLLNAGLTSTEIAAELYLAVSTVRTHIKNIYSKLAVCRRLEAIQKAKDLGLL